jgi:5'-nucleotidase
MTEAKYPYLAANIFDKHTAKHPHFPNVLPHILTKVGNIKVGIIGLTTLATPTTTLFTSVKDLRFENLKGATLREAALLRSKGAQLILITAHAGLECNSALSFSRSAKTSIIRTPSDFQTQCGDQDEIVRLLKSLPHGTVDGVVAGHTHQIVHHWIAGIPVIQGGAFGRYLNVIYFTYDFKQNKIVPDLTRIEGPVPVCQKVFENQKDCNGDLPAPSNGRGDLIPYYFHGKKIEPDLNVAALLAPVFKRADEVKNQTFGMAARPIEHYRMKESAMGNLIADALRKAAKTDFSYMNPGGVRAPLSSGLITFGNIFKTLPFENTISILKLTAKELKLLLTICFSGSRGFGSVSGLQLKLIDPAFKAPFIDLNINGKEEVWEFERLKEIQTSEGKPLLPKKYYTLATLDFLVNGGDDFAWFVTQIPKERVQKTGGQKVREVVIDYLKTSSLWNTDDHPLVDPKNPRIKFMTPKI